MRHEYAVAFINLALCAGVFWACICRLNTKRSKRNLYTRATYSLLLASAVVVALKPNTFGVFTVFLSGSVLIYLTVTIPEWRGEK